jgi:MFS family permease
LVFIAILLGLGLGLTMQPLAVTAMSRIAPPEYAQASSLSTVVRFVMSSLGVAVLATMVQSRAVTHVTALAIQARPTTLAALAMLKAQGLVLAVQDAFWVRVAFFIAAIVAACFIRYAKPVAAVKPANTGNVEIVHEQPESIAMEM